MCVSVDSTVYLSAVGVKPSSDVCAFSKREKVAVNNKFKVQNNACVVIGP